MVDRQTPEASHFLGSLPMGGLSRKGLRGACICILISERSKQDPVTERKTQEEGEICNTLDYRPDRPLHLLLFG